MAELVVFQLNDYVAVQDTIVEHQVGKIVFIIDNHPFLSCLETKSLSHFEQELLQMSNQGILQIIFRKGFRAQSKKLKREWVIDGNSWQCVDFRPFQQ